MNETAANSIDSIERSYEYLVAYASQDQNIDDTAVVEHVENIHEGLQNEKVVFQRETEEDGNIIAFFTWADEQTVRALGAIELFLRSEETTRESVEALLSLPSFRNSLTISLYLEEINEI